jgi:hypothetical protein
METEWLSITSEASLMLGYAYGKRARRGDYWNQYAKLTRIPYKTWGLGENAKYFRALTEAQRNLVESQAQRKTVAMICANHDYDYKQLVNIREDCTANGLYPRNSLIRNVCESNGAVSWPERPVLRFDWSTQDKQTITQDTPGSPVYRLRLPTGWITLRVPVPWRVNSKVFHKPLVRRREDGKLIIQVAYDVEPTEPTGDGLLGVDLGKIRNYAASTLYPDGSWVTGYSPSRETERLNEKQRRCESQRNELLSKRSTLRSMLQGKKQLTEVRAKLGKIEQELSLLRLRLINRKKHLARLTGRDVVSQAVALGCSRISMEDLFFTRRFGTKWAHGEIDRAVEQAAESHGIRVLKVSARNSSHEDPFTGSRSDPGPDRLTGTVFGSMDRDDSASLVLASRGLSKRPVAGHRKTKPTPRRPRLITRTHSHKLITHRLAPIIVALGYGALRRDTAVTRREVQPNKLSPNAMMDWPHGQKSHH